MDPEPDLGRAVVELRASRRGRDQPIEGPGGAAARRRGGGRRGRCGVAARALDGGAEVVGAVAERRLRGPRRVHGGPRRWICTRIWISRSRSLSDSWVGGVGEENEGDERRLGSGFRPCLVAWIWRRQIHCSIMYMQRAFSSRKVRNLATVAISFLFGN